MTTRLLRSLVLTTLLALVLGQSYAAPPSGFAPNPTDTRVAGIDVDATTIPELQQLMDGRRLKSVQLTQFYLHRIRKLNPTLNAVITVSPTALADARAADAARRAGDDRPLLGIPIIVKDNINTTGMATTAGSWALAGSTPDDAFIVQQLEAAGALIIGKANLSEWANFRSAPSSSGWSGIGDQTNMAYVLDRNPCGSSSGSGVIASADLAVAAVGTETDGSIVCPSGANANAGIKPTLGLLSRAGIVPISAEQDTAGPMARNVTDAAVLLGAMTGVDPDDPATAEQVGHAFTDYTQFLDGAALQGARIGVWREFSFEVGGEPVDARVSVIMEQTIAALRAAGATVIDPVDIPFGDWADAEFPALLCEFKTDIATYLQTYTGPGYPKTLQDLIDFNNDHPELESGGPESNWNSLLFEIAQQTNGRDAECAAQRAIATQGAQAAIDTLMASENLDAIIAPTNGPAWVTDPVNGDLGGDFSTFIGSSGPPAVAGYTNVTVPAGFVGPLPVGVSFIGGRWDEPRLIALAYAFEQATRVRVPPQFIPTIGDDAAALRGRSSHEKKQKTVAPGRGGIWRMPPLR
ncbi:MAG TPA: amidase [Steroidobacteraceae bacterium]|nr:amidase [Steroidobacteraceae bacterium]